MQPERAAFACLPATARALGRLHLGLDGGRARAAVLMRRPRARADRRALPRRRRRGTRARPLSLALPAARGALQLRLDRQPGPPEPAAAHARARAARRRAAGDGVLRAGRVRAGPAPDAGRKRARLRGDHGRARAELRRGPAERLQFPAGGEDARALPARARRVGHAGAAALGRPGDDAQAAAGGSRGGAGGDMTATDTLPPAATVALLWLVFGGTHVGLASARVRAALVARLG